MTAERRIPCIFGFDCRKGRRMLLLKIRLKSVIRRLGKRFFVRIEHTGIRALKHRVVQTDNLQPFHRGIGHADFGDRCFVFLKCIDIAFFRFP
ncbi:hypothetical protein NM2001072_2101 [Neisseria meningitidis 2001072]|nr:hypothetical protein NM2001072_2101 [Neisseria meningitidis 2001072]